jgi:hypothetical protein
MAGRPTKLTNELREKLCNLISDGWFINHACAEVGITFETYNTWANDGKEPDASEELKIFSESCARARAKAEQSVLEKAETAMTEGLDWKFYEWKLRVMNPKQYHLPTKTELSGPDGKPVQMQAVGVIALPPLGEEDRPYLAEGGVKSLKK